LLNEYTNAPHPLFIPSDLYNRTKLKVDAIRKLKNVVKSALFDKVADLKLLKEYLKEMEEMETVDLGLEIHKVQEKIKLIEDV
jgi:hypothetical protein